MIARYKAGKDLEQEDKVFKLPLMVDAEKATAYLEDHTSELNREAVDFGLTRENGAFKIIEGQDGIVVDVKKSVDAIDDSLKEGWKDDNTVELAAEVTKPQGSEEELSKVKDVLGTFSTNYASSAAGRKANIANGSKKINGSVIYLRLMRIMAISWQVPMKTVPLWMHMVVESVRYLLPCIMQSSVQNWK